MWIANTAEEILYVIFQETNVDFLYFSYDKSIMDYGLVQNT